MRNLRPNSSAPLTTKRRTGRSRSWTLKLSAATLSTGPAKGGRSCQAARPLTGSADGTSRTYPHEMRVRLAPGADPERAIQVVREIAGNTAAAVGVTSQHPLGRRNDYVRWAMNTEARLESVLQHDDAQAFFDTPRHRDISSSFLGDHLTTMIYSEIEARRRDFEDAASYLQRHTLTGCGGLPAFQS
jgi:hypothetical protein